MEFPFQINSLEILPERDFVPVAREQCTRRSHQLEGKRWQSSMAYLILGEINLPILPSNWFHLRSFSLDCDCHLDNWEAKACNYSQATLLSEPGGLCISFHPGWSQVRLAREGARRGESWIFLHGKGPLQATSTMEKRSEVLGSPLEFSWYEHEETRASCLWQILFSGDRICLEVANEDLGLLWLTGSQDNHYNVIYNMLWAVM